MGVTREMGFTRFVQNGRICLCNYGPDEGKLVMIVDVIDDKRCLCYAPDMARKVMTFKRLSLTDIVVENVGRGARKKTADAAWAACDVEGKWAATSWGKKLAARKSKVENSWCLEELPDVVFLAEGGLPIIPLLTCVPFSVLLATSIASNLWSPRR